MSDASTLPSASRSGTALTNTVVLGMHRSGTSAVTGCLHAFGLSLPHADALFDAPGNPHHHEPQPVLLHNDEALRATGAKWQYPIDLRNPPAAWIRQAGRVIEDVFPASPWVLKEPRMCVLLDAWLSVIPQETSFVVVVRDPSEVAASITRRDGYSADHGAALWEVYNAELERSLQGRRVIVMTFDEVRSSPQESLRRLGEFVGLQGEELDGAVTRAAATLDDALGASTPHDVVPYLTARWQHLTALSGTHDRLDSDPAPCAPWAIAELRSVQQTEVAALAAAKARRKPLRIALARLPVLGRLHDRRQASRENSLTP